MLNLCGSFNDGYFFLVRPVEEGEPQDTQSSEDAAG